MALIVNEMANNTIKIKNTDLAINVAIPAPTVPPKPNMLAITAITKKVNTKVNMCSPF